MGSIDIIKPLSTVPYINLANAENRTQGRWVQSENTIHCAICPPPPPNKSQRASLLLDRDPEELLEPRAVVDHAGGSGKGDGRLLRQPVQLGGEVLHLGPGFPRVAEGQVLEQGSQVPGQVGGKLITAGQVHQVAF